MALSAQLFLLLGILLNFYSLSASACVSGDSYPHRTLYSIVEDSSTILLVEPKSDEGENVLFNVVEVMKGTYESKVFRHSKYTGGDQFLTEINYPPALLRKFTPPNLKYILYLNKALDGWVLESNSIPFSNLNEPLLHIIRHFIRINSINNYEIQRSELRKVEKLAKSGRNGIDYPRQLAVEIRDEFDSPTPNKSFKDIKRLFDRSCIGHRLAVLRTLAEGRHNETADFLDKLMNSPIQTSYLYPICEFVTKTKNKKLLVRLGRTYPELDKSVRWPIMWALIETADGRYPDIMIKALRSADKEEAGELLSWFVRYPTYEAVEIARRLVGNEYLENYGLTLGLAGLGDVGVLRWARDFMHSSDEDRWIAYSVIAKSPLDEADNLAKEVIRRNDPKDLVSLIQGYEESQNPNRWNRLCDIIMLSNRDPKVDSSLKETLKAMSQSGDSKSAELIKSL